tara:strand:+ start:2663 stop:3685 length:1023 start_codon:yes stop_codon:yes gene_type:complete
MKNIFKNKKILITGASGSIGKAVLFKLLKNNCKVIRAMSNDENSLFELWGKIKKNSLIELSEQTLIHTSRLEKHRVRYIQGDVSDKARCITACEDIDIIIHAAAMKHVPFCEYNPFEATKTNVVGTENMVTAALENNVSRFILVSTDKVVNPTSVLGATKLLSERIVVNSNLNKGLKKTIFSCVRFGNVIGTRGSIMPYFIDQSKNSNKITVTTNNMTRYFMTIDQAVNTILFALNNMKGGEIFIPNDLKKFRIRDLAEIIKEKSNNKKLKIVLIGRRESEKENEKLYTALEQDNIKILKNFYIIGKNKNKKNFKLKAEKILSKKEISKSLKTYFNEVNL